MTERYTVVRSRSSASEFHARGIPDPARPEIWRHDITAPALVLGSSQRDEIVDREACRRAGVDVVRRRSGGGAVLLIPGEVTWIDVIIPRGGPGWATDIHTPMHWLGGHLAAIIASFPEPGGGLGEVTVHSGAVVATPWSATVCFDGIGAGEVLLDGAKLVGISQRRTREAARLQCCWYSHHDPTALTALLADPHRPPPAELRPVATLSPATAAAVADLLPTHLHA